MKTCSKCKNTLPFESFATRKISKDGYKNVCRNCTNQQQNYRYANDPQYKIKKKIYIEKNIEKITEYRNAYNAKYILQHKDELNKKSVEYYYENREALLLKKKDYLKENNETVNNRRKENRFKNRDTLNETRREYYKNNSVQMRIKLSVNNAKRRATKITTCDGTINRKSLKDLLNKQGGKCFYCECILDFNKKRFVHIDHYIPLSKGGKHTIANIVYSCQQCNLSKHDTLPHLYANKK